MAQLADFAAVGVQVHDARARRELGQLAGGAVVEAGADAHQQVGFLHGDVGRAAAVHAQHAQQLRMVRGQRAQAAQREHGGHAAGFDEAAERVHRVGQGDAAAAVHHRALGRGDGFDGAGDVIPRRRRGRRRRRGDTGNQVRGIGQLHVLGQVDQHGAGAAFAGDAEGFVHDAGQVIHAAHEEAVLDDRQRHAEHVQLLEGVGAHQRGADLAGDHHHRRRIQEGIGDAGDQVRRARARRGHAHADAAAGAGVAVGSQRGALFVAHQDVLELRAGQGVVEGHDGAARVAEQQVHALGLECARQQLGAVLFGVHAVAASGWGAGAGARGAVTLPSAPIQLMAARSLRPVASMGWSKSACFMAL